MTVYNTLTQTCDVIGTLTEHAHLLPSIVNTLWLSSHYVLQYLAFMGFRNMYIWWIPSYIGPNVPSCIGSNVKKNIHIVLYTFFYCMLLYGIAPSAVLFHTVKRTTTPTYIFKHRPKEHFTLLGNRVSMDTFTIYVCIFPSAYGEWTLLTQCENSLTQTYYI